jgi:hypothetical protein
MRSIYNLLNRRTRNASHQINGSRAVNESAANIEQSQENDLTNKKRAMQNDHQRDDVDGGAAPAFGKLSNSAFDEFYDLCCEPCQITRPVGIRGRAKDKDDTRTSTRNDRVLPSTRCPLCRSLLEMTRLRLTDEDLTIRLVLDQLASDNPYDILTVIFSTNSGSETLSFGFPELPSDCIPQFRRPEPLAIDFEEVRAWLDRCRSDHPVSCSTLSAFSVPGFRVIDCWNGNIVPLPKASESRYIALSYVWGDTQRETTGYPKTIDDSIQVAHALGIRYLWVDRYVS